MAFDRLPHDHGEMEDMSSFSELLSGNTGFERVSKVMSQLGDASRLKIFWLLCHHEECVINISAIMGMSSPAISHHLRALKDGGLIVSRREGKEVYYKAADTPEADYIHHMIEELMEITCPES